jgi:hypothetical protein
MAWRLVSALDGDERSTATGYLMQMMKQCTPEILLRMEGDLVSPAEAQRLSVAVKEELPDLSEWLSKQSAGFYLY